MAEKGHRRHRETHHAAEQSHTDIDFRNIKDCRQPRRWTPEHAGPGQRHGLQLPDTCTHGPGSDGEVSCNSSATTSGATATVATVIVIVTVTMTNTTTVIGAYGAVTTAASGSTDISIGDTTAASGSTDISTGDTAAASYSVAISTADTAAASGSTDISTGDMTAYSYSVTISTEDTTTDSYSATTSIAGEQNTTATTAPNGTASWTTSSPLPKYPQETTATSAASPSLRGGNPLARVVAWMAVAWRPVRGSCIAKRTDPGAAGGTNASQTGDGDSHKAGRAVAMVWMWVSSKSQGVDAISGSVGDNHDRARQRQ